MPGNKPGSGSGPEPAEQKPRKPRIQGFARRRMEPTDRVEHAVIARECPVCKKR